MCSVVCKTVFSEVLNGDRATVVVAVTVLVLLNYSRYLFVHNKNNEKDFSNLSTSRRLCEPNESTRQRKGGGGSRQFGQDLGAGVLVSVWVKTLCVKKSQTKAVIGLVHINRQNVKE